MIFFAVYGSSALLNISVKILRRSREACAINLPSGLFRLRAYY
jgi:hypothetical protein